MIKAMRRFAVLLLFGLWCIAIYEPETPEMDKVGSQLYSTIRLGLDAQSDVEALLDEKGADSLFIDP